MTRTFNRDELQRMLSAADAPILIEALPERYYAAGHLPGARHLPHDEVKQRAGEVAPDKSKPIVVYCASETCRNSHQAAAAFEMLGYTDVAVYPGGKQDWESAGFNLVKD